jgi:antitoxin VapB
MGKQLNIKSDRLYAKVERLADLTGASMTGAIEAAVDEKLGREERARDVTRRTQEILHLAAELRASLKQPLPSQKDLDDWLYDEQGLPR